MSGSPSLSQCCYGQVGLSTASGSLLVQVRFRPQLRDRAQWQKVVKFTPCSILAAVGVTPGRRLSSYSREGEQLAGAAAAPATSRSVVGLVLTQPVSATAYTAEVCTSISQAATCTPWIRSDCNPLLCDLSGPPEWQVIVNVHGSRAMPRVLARPYPLPSRLSYSWAFRSNYRQARILAQKSVPCFLKGCTAAGRGCWSPPWAATKVYTAKRT